MHLGLNTQKTIALYTLPYFTLISIYVVIITPAKKAGNV